MTPAKARVHALQAALETRAAQDTPDAIIARAKKFEEYIAADGLAVARQEASLGRSFASPVSSAEGRAASPDGGDKASQEKASAGAQRRK